MTAQLQAVYANMGAEMLSVRMPWVLLLFHPISHRFLRSKRRLSSQRMMANNGTPSHKGYASLISIYEGFVYVNILPHQMVALHCTHSNLNRRMIEIRFDLHMTIGDLKHKLHRHTGTPAFSQRLILKARILVKKYSKKNKHSFSPAGWGSPHRTFRR